MTDKLNYPAVKLLRADALAAKGGIFISCYLLDGTVYPALKAELASADCPENVTFAGYAEKPQKLIVAAEDGLYFSKNGTEFTQSQTEFAANSPFMFDKQDDTDEAYLAGDETLLLIKPAINTVLPFDCGIFGGVIKNGRLFALDKENGYKIRWSGAGGGTDWTEGINGAGWVNIYPERGKILNLVNYRQKLIAVCEYGLVSMSAFGAPENYKLGYIDGATGAICKNTAAVAGGKLVFCTNDGLCAYNGIKVEKLDAFAGDIKDPFCALSFGGRYAVCGFSKKLGKNAVFVLDMQKGAGYAVNKAVTAMCNFNKPYLFGTGGAYALEQGNTVDFTSGEIDFGSPKRKVLKEVRIGSASAVEVGVTNGVKTRIFRCVKGCCRPNMGGTRFKITVRGSGKLDGVTAYAEEIDGI